MIARAFAFAIVAMGPGLAWAGPPVLPPSTSPGVEPPAPNAPVSDPESGFAGTPVQRPSGMPQARFAPVRPATPGQPVQPARPTEPTTPATTPAVEAVPPPATPPAAEAVPPPASGPTASVAVGPAPSPAAAPRRSSAPASRIGPAEPDSAAPEAALVATAEPPRKRFQHQGIVADVRIGTLGCIGALCRGAHGVSPGVRLGGFLGGNIRGWVELGVGGGWGTLGSKVAPGTNAMTLYGLDPNVLQYALLAQLVDVNLSGLAVQDDRLRAAQVGPSLRVHVLPRGRFGAFVGTGVGYNVLRARYQTAMGDVGLDFHGLDVPVEANFSVYVLEHLAVGVQFDYMWTWYGLAVLDHPQARIPIPMRLLEPSAATQGIDVRAQLPQFWTLGLAIRGRL